VAVAVAASCLFLLPYPSQGPIHLMLQFGKRLALHGLLALRRIGDALASVRLAVSVGFCFGECGAINAYLSRLEDAG